MKRRPLKTKIGDLDVEKRTLLRKVIKQYCYKNSIYSQSHAKGIGLETTEEGIEELINLGELVIRYNPKQETFSINPWYIYL